MVQPGWRTVRRFLKKLKIELPRDPAASLLQICLDKTIIQKDPCTPMFIAAVLRKLKTWKQPRFSPNKEDVVHIYGGMLLSHTKE